MKNITLTIIILFGVSGCVTSPYIQKTEEDKLFDKNKWVEINKNDNLKKELIYEQK